MNRCNAPTIVLLLLSGCSEPRPSTTEDDGQISTASESGVTTDEAEMEEETGAKLDLGMESDLPGGEEVGCEKIDFLFVIDSSGSMADNQSNLIASFPGLVTAMMENVAADDWHVMVIDTDGQWGGTECANACMSLGSCPDEPAFDCDQPPPGVCDISLGSGQVGPVGEGSSNMDCALAGGRRYIQAGEPDLLDAFSCIAKVGVDGSDLERPMDAMVHAVGSDHVEVGGCNEGFVRDDAILVITIITDETDDYSEGDPVVWADALIAAKGGQSNAVVVLGLLPDEDFGMPLCEMDAEPAGLMNDFLQLFENNVRASVCEPDYSPFFVDAVSVISEACDDFVPIG